MAKQRKYILTLDYEYDYEMIGICSHHVDYRLVWSINETLKLQLAKAKEDFVVVSKKGQIPSQHSFFEFKDVENLVEYYLIKNKSEGKYLIPEKQDVDYFLFLREISLDDSIEFIKKLKTVSSILAIFQFNPEEIASTENLIFN
jgi:hypothetical protein